MATLAMFFRRPVAAPAAQSGAAQSGSVPVDDRYVLRALPNEDIILYSKPIDNSRVVREPDPTARGEWRMIGMACVLAILFMGLLTPRVANIFAGYKLESLKQEQQQLLDEQRDLDIVEARLSREENLEVLAKQRELGTPVPGQVVHLDPRSDSKLALNRH
ncbi:MAG TPA: hypothetical protein VMG35_13700 [Bryobacteraceae bacterium]|nr:hypothetical protein [Bryobacteraceae bacterium]